MTGGSKTRISGVLTVGVPVTAQDQPLEFYMARSVSRSAGISRWAAGGGGSRWRHRERRQSSRSSPPPNGVPAGVRFTTADADGDRAALPGERRDADDVLRWPGVPAMSLSATVTARAWRSSRKHERCSAL